MIASEQVKIMDKTNQILEMISQSEEMLQFRTAEDKLNRHGDAQALLFVVRARRNAYSQTSLRHGYDHPASIQAKQELDDTLSQIAEIPLIEQYQQSQEDLNELLQGVLKLVVTSLHDVIPVEVYDDTVTGGCGSGGGCGNCGKH